MANNVVYFDPSLKIESITPTLDDETFQFFLETYYEWMQTSNVEIISSTGAFINGETIVGQISKASAKVNQVSDGYIIVKMNTDVVFEINETIVGQTSSNTAVVGTIDDNIIRETSRTIANKDPRRAVGDYLSYLKEDLNRGIPLQSSTKRREIIGRLRDLFKSKSTEEAYKSLFKALFNEIIEIRFPGDDLLRVSDGNFIKRSTIRVDSDAFGSDIFEFLNTTIRGRTSDAVAVVSDIRISFLGGIRYADFILRLISGEFSAGEIVEEVENPSLRTTVFGVVARINIIEGGTGYEIDDEIIIEGDGTSATAKVSSIDTSPISSVLLANTGVGYRLNSNAVIDNTGTGGANLAIRVSGIQDIYEVSGNTYTVGEISEIRIVNRGEGYVGVPTITLEDTTISALGLLHEKLIRIDNPGDSYRVGDPLVFTGGSGSGAVGEVAAVRENFAIARIQDAQDENDYYLLLEDGDTLSFEDDDLVFEDRDKRGSALISTYANQTFLDDFMDSTILFENGLGLLYDQEFNYYNRLKSEDWRAIGPIERLELSNYGSGYTPEDLPVVTVNSVVEFISFTNPDSPGFPILLPQGTNAELTPFNIQGRGATVQVDLANNIAGLGAIREVTVVDQGLNYTSANVNATGSGDGNANLAAEISGLFVNPGFFANDDGKVNFKVIQDSLFYQDFSYVIRSGLSFTDYRDIVKQAIHPAGLEFFGEIVITSTIDVSARFLSEFSLLPGQEIPSQESVLTVPSFLSLFADAAIAPPTAREIQIEIAPLRFAPTLNTHREINVEITPVLTSVALSLGHGEYRPIITPAPIDIALFPSYANVIAQPLVQPVEFDFYLSGTSVASTEDREFEVEVNLFMDATMAFYSEIQIVETGIKEVEIDIELLQNVSATISQFLNFGFVLEQDLSINLDKQITLIPQPSIIDKTISVIGSEEIFSPRQIIPARVEIPAEFFGQYEIDIIPTSQLTGFIFADLPIETFAGTPIQTYQTSTFNDFTFVGGVEVATTHAEYNIEVLSFVDATMAFYSAIITLETDIRTTEIDIELLADLSANIETQIDSKYLLEVSVSTSTFTENEYQLELLSYADLTMAFYSDIVTIESEIKSIELDIELFKNVAIVTTNKIEIDILVDDTNYFLTSTDANVKIEISPEKIIQSANIISWEQLDLGKRNIQSEIALDANTDSEYRLDIMLNDDRYFERRIDDFKSSSLGLYDNEELGSRIAIGRSTFESRLTQNVFYKDIELFAFENEPLTKLSPIFLLEDGENMLDEAQTIYEVEGFYIQEQGVTFNDKYSTSKGINGNRKIPGTVSIAGNTVIGTSTDFPTYFFVNDSIIIDDEKFIIREIANSTHMTLNVNAAENYTDVSAYREFFV